MDQVIYISVYLRRERFKVSQKISRTDHIIKSIFSIDFLVTLCGDHLQFGYFALISLISIYTKYETGFFENNNIGILKIGLDSKRCDLR